MDKLSILAEKHRELEHLVSEGAALVHNFRLLHQQREDYSFLANQVTRRNHIANYAYGE